MKIAVYGLSAFAEGLRTVLLERGHMLTSASDADVVWLAQTTRVDPSGAPVAPTGLILPVGVPPETPILMSEEWPVGTFDRLCPPMGRPMFYVMENVKQGSAAQDLRDRWQWVVGASQLIPSSVVELLDDLQVVSPVAAEMTKHTLNAFMALQIAFMNEVGRICEDVGADSREVVFGMARDPRISPQAPIMPGAPFKGTCLRRGVRALEQTCPYDAPVLWSILPSNGDR